MFQSLINLFFPEVCLGCSRLLLSNELVICTRCRHEIPQTLHYLNPNNEAFRKFYGKIAVEHVSAFAYFQKKGLLQPIIHALKYQEMEAVGTLFGHWYAADLKNLEFIKDVDLIIPVPLHPRKLRERGYNQVSSFGRSLSEELQIELNESLLIRTVYSKTQTKKNLLSRTEVQNKNIFDVSETNSYQGKHILLIDDVLTTGSTLEACCRALLKIPEVKISIVCIAMTS
jgi:ComF family protein